MHTLEITLLLKGEEHWEFYMANILFSTFLHLSDITDNILLHKCVSMTTIKMYMLIYNHKHILNKISARAGNVS